MRWQKVAAGAGRGGRRTPTTVNAPTPDFGSVRHALEAAPDRRRIAEAYCRRATAPLRLMIPLTNNMRVLILYLACLTGDPRWFWWIELGPLSAIAVAGIIWHRRVEAALVRAQPA